MNSIQSLKDKAPITDHYEFDFAGGMRLSEHATSEKTLNLIQSKKWDYVVLQGHSKEPLIWFDDFYDAVKTLSEEIRKNGSTPLLFMTWARTNENNYLVHQQIIINKYNQIGKDFDIKVVPIGEIYLAIHSEKPKLFEKLYRNDGIHQTALGSYIVANSFYKAFHGSNLLWSPSNIDEQTVVDYINSYVSFFPQSKHFIGAILHILLDQ